MIVDNMVMGAVVATMTSEVMVTTMRVVAQLKKHEVNNHNQDMARKPYIDVTGLAYAGKWWLVQAGMWWLVQAEMWWLVQLRCGGWTAEMWWLVQAEMW